MSYAEDVIAITEVKARYCRLMDTKDWAGWADVFTEDFVLDTSPAGGAPAIQGRDKAIAYVRSSIETAKTAHQVHNPEIQVEGDTARVIWAMQDRVIFGPERADIGEAGHTGYGQYHETYRREGGRWRIATLQLRYLIYDSHPRA